MIRTVSFAVLFFSFAYGLVIWARAALGTLPESSVALPAMALLANVTLPTALVISTLASKQRDADKWRRKYGFSTPKCVERLESQARALWCVVLALVASTLSLIIDFPAALPVVYGTAVLFGISGLIYTRRALIAARLIESLLRRHHRPCMICGYDLTPGNLERCPECGTPRENPR